MTVKIILMNIEQFKIKGSGGQADLIFILNPNKKIFQSYYHG
ncbi:MAG: hypothetical protein PF447_15290 [Spirochaetaceae bacterium]|nr:hypothetical protein [Spirochaetaceae bacterium]